MKTLLMLFDRKLHFPRGRGVTNVSLESSEQQLRLLDICAESCNLAISRQLF